MRMGLCAMGDDGDWSVMQQWVGPDYCTVWYHLRCLGLKEMPKAEDEWMRPPCEKDMEEEG